MLHLRFRWQIPTLLPMSAQLQNDTITWSIWSCKTYGYKASHKTELSVHMLGDKGINYVNIFLGYQHIIYDHCYKFMRHGNSTGSQALGTIQSRSCQGQYEVTSCLPTWRPVYYLRKTADPNSIFCIWSVACCMLPSSLEALDLDANKWININ